MILFFIYFVDNTYRYNSITRTEQYTKKSNIYIYFLPNTVPQYHYCDDIVGLTIVAFTKYFHNDILINN